MQEEGCISCDWLHVEGSFGVSVRVNSNGDHTQLTFRLTLAVWYTTPGQPLTLRPQYRRHSGIKPHGVWRECEIGTGLKNLVGITSWKQLVVFKVETISTRESKETGSKTVHVEEHIRTSSGIQVDSGIWDLIIEIFSLKYVAKSSQRESEISGSRFVEGFRAESIIEK